MTDQEMIERFIETKGITKCPAAAAYGVPPRLHISPEDKKLWIDNIFSEFDRSKARKDKEWGYRRRGVRNK